MVGDLTAAELPGLRNWHRDAVTVLVPHATDVGAGCPGVEFVRSRRPLREHAGAEASLSAGSSRGPGFRLPAGSPRTAEGVLAAAVQQRLTSPAEL